MHKHSACLYRAQEVRELDRRAIESYGIAGYSLMSRAGQASFEQLRDHWPEARRILVLCGAGNNAGDGYVIARLCRQANRMVDVMSLVDPETLREDARRAFEAYIEAGGEVGEWDAATAGQADVIVDAMLGTGLSRDLSPRFASVVQAVNATGRPVLAVDIPTGLHADTGRVMGTAIRAAVTVTFIGTKLGLYLAEAKDHVGKLVFAGLDVTSAAYEDLPLAGRVITPGLIRQVLPQRRRTAHKGDHGRLLLIGGGRGMPGAIRLAGEAALHAGAGLVTVATREEHVPIVLAGRPELMCHSVRSAVDLHPLLAQADVVALGPGLARDDWSQSLYQAVLSTDLPLVLDADALNLLAQKTMRRDGWILTPHPGEAARLLGSPATPQSVQGDRLSAVTALVERYGGVVVLKGAGTIVMREDEMPWICDRGNPGMAAPGMGDLLTGVIAGVAVQSKDLFDAARVGVFVHAAAGDDAAVKGERGVLASELLPYITKWVNPPRSV